VTKGEYPYPADEFDGVDPSDGPRGVHRRPRGRWATVWPYLAALVASAALAYVVIGFVWTGRGVAPSAQPTTEVSESTGATDPEATAGTAAPTEPEPTPAETTAAPEPSATPTPAPTAEPDLGTPVLVLNSTSVSGLASAAAAELEDAGWTAVSSGNFRGGTLPASTVRYASADLEASARAVATELGITAVELADPDAGEAIEVVLEADFTG
jgi:hypothetical protein